MKKQKFQPEVGDIVFSRKSGFMSWFIRLLQAAFPYSHVCIIGEEVDGEATVYTIGFGGKGRRTYGLLPASECRQLNAKQYLKDKSYVICRYEWQGKTGLTPKQKAAILKWCHSQLGRKYPFKKTVDMFRLYLRGNGINKIATQPQYRLCYELVAEAYSKAGIELNKRAENIDPSGYDAREIYLSPNLVNISTRKGAL